MGREGGSIDSDKSSRAYIPAVESEKIDTRREESPEIEKSVANVDPFGSATKTDPVEIKLVKKLDLYIMVCLLAVSRRPSYVPLYYCIQVSNLGICATYVACPLADVLAELP